MVKLWMKDKIQIRDVWEMNEASHWRQLLAVNTKSFMGLNTEAVAVPQTGFLVPGAST